MYRTFALVSSIKRGSRPLQEKEVGWISASRFVQRRKWLRVHGQVDRIGRIVVFERRKRARFDMPSIATAA